MNGHLVDSVGGGISQFATTLFNAAFFGGLEFDAYQAHSILSLIHISEPTRLLSIS